ncbi:MAG: hypothetical protein BWY69_00361 [Planctomycetes bacterium ADurb.Bin401]|nr:MAG: hypothetical protein BWY69_00361 [Planctomycetes bacterium ADurb.Bin401]
MFLVNPVKKNSKIITALLFMLLIPACLFSAEDNHNNHNNQLKINHWTLFNSTDEQIRIDTAVELLQNYSAQARVILLDALKSGDNISAASSACKAISKFRSASNLIVKRDDFIQPLMAILKGPNVDLARLAAEATLIFNYREIKSHLEQIIKNNETTDLAKKNAIYALQIRPDRETILLLIELMDSSNPVVSSAAIDALQEWMPIGSNRQDWQKIRRDIERGKFDVIRERILFSQDKIQKLNDDIVKWQKKYLTSLDNIYFAMAEDNVRAKFVAENLSFEQSSVKLWAVEKINMWQKSGKLLPIDVMQKPLIALVSDKDPLVRLAVAKLLGLLTNINSADALLRQLKAETFPEVKTEMFVALGHVCNFALSPGSEVQINPKIRIETLKNTVAFFKEGNPAVSAEVIRNLLLQNGLEISNVKPYMEFIAANYNKAADQQVRIRLLEEMERLCGNDSFYRTTAGEVFRNIFLEACDDTSSLVASPAVSGLLKIDQAGAFEILKTKQFFAHSSEKVRNEMINVAGQIGTAQDLEWLAALADNSEFAQERQKAADAMMSIFQFCKTDVLITWAKRLSVEAKTRNDDLLLVKSRTLFEMAEKKAEAQQDANTLASLRRTLADSYSEAKHYAQAARYYGILLQSATDSNEREYLTSRLLEVNLYDGQSESAKQLIANILLSNDIGEEKQISKILNQFFSENPEKEHCTKIFRAIASIHLADAAKYPLWNEQLAKWRTLLKFNVTPPGPNVPAVADSNSVVKK